MWQMPTSSEAPDDGGGMEDQRGELFEIAHILIGR
jgi:hypothetical protein